MTSKPNAPALFTLAACLLGFVASAWTPARADKPTKVTLERRADNGAYGESAYSFRYASQEFDAHRNAVDLVLNNCGNLHIGGGGAENRVARVEGRKLSDIEALPEDGWSENCFSAEESALYVMLVDDGMQRFHVALRVLDVKSNKLVFEWQRFVPPAGAEHGTLGSCAGEHSCS